MPHLLNFWNGVLWIVIILWPFEQFWASSTILLVTKHLNTCQNTETLSNNEIWQRWKTAKFYFKNTSPKSWKKCPRPRRLWNHKNVFKCGLLHSVQFHSDIYQNFVIVCTSKQLRGERKPWVFSGESVVNTRSQGRGYFFPIRGIAG